MHAEPKAEHAEPKAERPVMKLRERLRSELRCAWCHGELGGIAWLCPLCGTRLHVECRAAAFRCPTFGCREGRGYASSDSGQVPVANARPVEAAVQLPITSPLIIVLTTYLGAIALTTASFARECAESIGPAWPAVFFAGYVATTLTLVLAWRKVSTGASAVLRGLVDLGAFLAVSPLYITWATIWALCFAAHLFSRGVRRAFVAAGTWS